MINFQKISSKSVPLNRGVNENRSALELTHSELTSSINYELSDGMYAGLTTLNGYEVYDGTALASSTEVEFHENGLMILTGDELEGGGFATEDGDTARLSVRDAITPPTGDGPILAIFEYKDRLWCIRDDSGQHKLHWVSLDADELTGWPNTAIDIPGATVTPVNPTGIYKLVIGRFANFHGNAEVVILTNGITTAALLYTNEEGASEVSTIDSKYLPSASGQNDSDTVLLLHPDLPDGSTTFIDDSVGGTTHIISITGDVVAKNEETIMGQSSVYFDGDGDGLDIPASTDFSFGTEDFTVEWWEYCDAKQDNSSVYCCTQDFRFNIGEQLTDNRQAYLSSDGTTWDILSGLDMGTIDYKVWTHLALVREGETFTSYKNGVEVATSASALAIYDNGEPLKLGQSDSGESIEGYIAELRVSKGVARWSEDFIPRTTPYEMPKYPYLCEVWNERLILGYPDGQVYFHQPGSDPTNNDNWDASIASAGVINLEDTLTNFLVAPSSCFLFCEGLIKYMSQLSFLDESTGVDFTVKTFSPKSGAIWNTVNRVLGEVLFCDDRGISSLSTSEAFGDFKASILSKNIQNTYRLERDNIVGAYVDRESNQYKVVHQHPVTVSANITSGITMTLNSGEGVVKGITLFRYPIEFKTTFENKWLGGEDGYVYKNWDGAESFNCEKIPAGFTTSFGTYGNSTTFKSFKKLVFEESAERGTELSVRCSYDYDAADVATGFLDWIDTSLHTDPAPWGVGEWGAFRYGVGVENKEHVYLYGVGSNMAVTVGSSDRYHRKHTIHNFITQYSLRSIDF